ncbi:cytochrome P450, partial [Dunaliella salina]
QDLRRDLLLSLLEAGAKTAQRTLSDGAEGLSFGLSRVQRLLQPPPPGFPPGPRGDSAVSLISAPLDFLERTKQEHGTIVGLMLGGERVVLVADPAAAKQALIDDAAVFGKEGTAFFPGSSLTGNGLLVSDGEVHKRQRRLSNPAFRKAAVETYAAAMVSATQNTLINRWQSGGERNVYADFNELTLEITLDALFGIHASDSGDSLGSSTEVTEVVDAVAMAFEFFTRRAGGIPIPENIPTWDNLQFGSAVTRLDRVVYRLIDERRQELAATGGTAEGAERKDLLNSLLVSVDDDGQGMSNEALRSELMTLLVAGQETSGILLGWATALLAYNPEVQEKAVAEVEAVLQGRRPEAADTRLLPYIEAVVLESLRLYSPAYMVGRCAQQDTNLQGWPLQAWTTVLVSPYLLHRDPAVWGPDSTDFRPERWQQWQDEAGGGGFMALLSGLGPNGAYLPFGGGPRNCIGTYFAMQEAILVIATVLQLYRLMPPHQASFPVPKPLITLRPEEVRLQVVPRYS